MSGISSLAETNMSLSVIEDDLYDNSMTFEAAVAADMPVAVNPQEQNLPLHMNLDGQSMQGQCMDLNTLACDDERQEFFKDAAECRSDVAKARDELGCKPFDSKYATNKDEADALNGDASA